MQANFRISSLVPPGMAVHSADLTSDKLGVLKISGTAATFAARVSVKLPGDRPRIPRLRVVCNQNTWPIGGEHLRLQGDQSHKRAECGASR